MVEVLNKHPRVIQIAEQAIIMAGLPVIRKAIRGGTDGATLSFKGVPTPNLFTGGHNFHSKKELIPIPALYKGVEVLLNIIELAQKG
jgi:tripeptide aminopeptidase